VLEAFGAWLKLNEGRPLPGLAAAAAAGASGGAAAALAAVPLVAAALDGLGGTGDTFHAAVESVRLCTSIELCVLNHA
jgi:transportin-3